MKLHCLTITNFRSFKGEQTFRFPDDPGLYFMQGVNKSEPRLEANGAGKTTIWDALTWLFFAKTAKGLKAGDVCNWEAGKRTSVELAFEDGDGAVSLKTMKRTWGPNSWTLQDLFGNVTDLTKDQSNQVLALLRLDFAPFLNSVLMAQGQPMFLDLKHDAKAALFSDVMGLDLWLDYSAKASKKASAQDAVSRGYERELAGLRATLAQIQGQDLKAHNAKWQAEQDALIKDLELQYEQALVKHANVKKDMAGLAEVAKVRRNEYHDDTKFLDAAIADVKTSLAGLQRVKEAATVAKTKYASTLEAREELRSGKCPTCGQTVKHTHEAPSAAEVKKKLEATDHAAKVLKAALEDHDDLVQAEERAADAVANSKKKMQRSEDDERDARQSLQRLERELDALEDKVEELVKQKSPYAGLQKLQREQGEQVVADIEDKQRLLDDSNSRYSLYSFWVRGFKEVRLQLIAEALQELEIEVNNCVMDMGLVDWELNFLVDRETKGGNIQRGFNVVVTSPHNANPVPWEAWSGGEAQRLRIAAQEGLGNLIRSRTGTSLNLEVWDEPTNGLSGQGIKDLLDSLAARAQRESRQVWLIDHTAHSFGGFAGGAIITKTAKGSSLTQY